MKIYLLLISALVLLSCGDQELNQNTLDQLDAEHLIHECKAFINNQDYDLDVNGQRFQSIVYSSETKECKSILLFRNDSLVVVREIQRNITTNDQTEYSYYFSNGELYLYQEISNQPKNDGSILSKEYVLLYKDGEPTRAWQNEAINGAIDPFNFKEAKTKKVSPDNALDMFNNENNYALHFEDFLETNGELYLLVNTIKGENFISALKVEKMDDFLMELKKDKTKHKNAPLKIKHEAVNDNGWIMHYYVHGTFNK